MAKRPDKEKEQKFIENFCEGDTQGNATKSCVKSGWRKDTNPAQMGAYLRKKLSTEIRERQEDRISGTTGTAISVLQDLLHSDIDAVKLNTARLILELGNYSSQTINLNVDKIGSKTDKELVEELQSLLKDMPNLRPDLQNYVASEEEKQEIDLNKLKDNEKIVKH